MIAVSVSKSPFAGVERAPQALVSIHTPFTICVNMRSSTTRFHRKTSSWTKDVHLIEPSFLKGVLSHLLLPHLLVTGYWYSLCSGIASSDSHQVAKPAQFAQLPSLLSLLS
jgi:hypothetical protein